jgi:sugar O-acyltransferase (sialic acid O-acetyltransferase NeuD family)
MRDLYILGAGGHGREVLNTILDIHAIQGARWNIMGFLDDTEDPLKEKNCDYPVVGTIAGYQPKENDVLVMGIANPMAKEKIVTMLKSRGAVFDSIIYPYANLGRHNLIGEGAVICGGFGMSVNVSIGNFPTLLNCGLGHDVTVGDYCTISPCCNIMGNVKIGRRVFIGGNAAIAPHVVIEDDAYVGVGSVVLKRVKAGEKVFGNPAREIGI